MIRRQKIIVLGVKYKQKKSPLKTVEKDYTTFQSFVITEKSKSANRIYIVHSCILLTYHAFYWKTISLKILLFCWLFPN